MAKLFIELGWTELESPSRKYRKFYNHNKAETFYWLGKAGAVRRGRTSSSATSVTAYWNKFLSNHLQK